MVSFRYFVFLAFTVPFIATKPFSSANVLTGELNIIKMYPDHAEVYYKLGNAYAKKNMYTTALSQWEKAVELDPKLVNAYYNLGLVCQKIGKLDEAIEAYKKVLDINVGDVEVHKCLGFLYKEKDMRIESESEFALYKKLKSTQP